MRIDRLIREATADSAAYNFAFLDESSKREIRRATLKAIAIPGHQVPFGSRELPLARGWGTGGLQLSLSLVGPGDTFKCIDQGDDASMNAVRIRGLVARTAGVETTLSTSDATIIQTRHRVPEHPLREDQLLVLQVPSSEPLDRVEPRRTRTLRMHAERDYSKMWLYLYESIARSGEISVTTRYPAIVNDSYLVDPSPIPRWDVLRLDDAPFLSLFGAGREKRIYAIPPYTSVAPLEFEDHEFRVERFDDPCQRCGSVDSYLHAVPGKAGRTEWMCSDTSFCDDRASRLRPDELQDIGAAS